MLPLSHPLILAAALFVIAAAGVILRRNVLIVFMGIELMLNSANLTLLTYATKWGDDKAHVFVFLVIAVAAAEAAVGLAIVVGIFRTRRSANLDELSLLKH
jgi:NADH-quinone oxidoreductase subunit K